MMRELFPPVINDAGLFTRRTALAEGWSDHDLRKSPDIFRVIHGVYALSSVELTHWLKCRAVAMRFPADAIISGRSAATLRGAALAQPRDRVEVLVSGRKYMNRRYGTRCWSVRSWPKEHEDWFGIRLATAERAAYDILARSPLSAGIADVDAMLHANVVDTRSLERFLEGRHDHGIRRARRAFEYLDRRAESIPESRLRVALVLAGLCPQPQFEVWDPQGFVARVDFAFPREKVAVEYDGAWHGDAEQFYRDQKRLARLRASGWHVIVVTADRLRSGYDGLIAEIQAALLARR